MEMKGEFEQRPEVRPADQIPLPKAKANPLPWILCVVLALAVGGLIIWKLTDAGGQAKCDTDKGGSSTVASSDNYDTIRKTKKIVKDVRNLAIKYAKDHYALSGDGYNIAYEYEEGFTTNTEWEFGFHMKASNSSSTDDWYAFENKVTKNTGFQSDLKEKMKSHGLSEKKYDDGVTFGDDSVHYVSDDGYICEASTAGAFYFGCAHADWISNEKKELVKALSEALKKGLDIKNDDTPLFVEASVDDIADSKNAPYQIISAALADAGVVFYRKGADSEWVYAFGGQAAPYCGDFKGEMKTIFEGWSCMDENSTSGSMGTVKK